jgi:antirestriction protein ArdC
MAKAKKKSKGPSADELRQTVTDRLIEALEAGTRPWIKPWIGDPNAGFPTNVDSKKRYRGVNPWLLDMTANAGGYTSKWWGTYKQWKGKGGQVIKGETGTLIVFWKIFDRDVIDPQTGVKSKKKTFFLRYSKVFNLDQVENAGEVVEGKPHKLDKLRTNTNAPIKFEHDEFEPAEAIIAESGASVTYGGNRACYNPGTDAINCPAKDQFPKLSEFYNTMFHELTHWCESRTGFSKVDERNYALGELVAEIGSCYVASHIGVPVEQPTDDQSAAYLASWLKKLKDDPKFIFVASKWASKAADLLLGEEIAVEGEPTEEPVADKQAA